VANSKYPTAEWPVADSLFGSPEYSHNYVILNTWLRHPFDKPPKHLLEIPRDWRAKWAGDYPIQPLNFGPRNYTLAQCAEANRQALADSMTGDGTPDEWHLLFRLGTWGEDSVLHMAGDAAELNIKSRLTLVRPTADEIRKLGRG
jgi:hypothetical protein